MRQDWIWGEVPPGFIRMEGTFNATILVREELKAFLGSETFLGCGVSDRRTSPFQGREPLRSLVLENGNKALIRAYRHGGLFRFLTRRLFFTWPPRPFRELAITEKVRRRGIPTVEVYAACVESLFAPFYRGWLMTREVEGASDLWTALTGNVFPDLEARYLWEAAAVSIRRLHRQGVYHRDLNLKNLLLRREARSVKVYIIDFDKARLFSGSVPAVRARRNLDRLLRSVRKLDPKKRFVSEEDWRHFVRLYTEAGTDAR